MQVQFDLERPHEFHEGTVLEAIKNILNYGSTEIEVPEVADDESTVREFELLYNYRAILKWAERNTLDTYDDYGTIHIGTSLADTVIKFYQEVVAPIKSDGYFGDDGAYWTARGKRDDEALEEAYDNLWWRLTDFDKSMIDQDAWKELCRYWESFIFPDETPVIHAIKQVQGPDYNGEFYYEPDLVLAKLIQAGMLAKEWNEYEDQTEIAYVGQKLLDTAAALVHQLPLPTGDYHENMTNAYMSRMIRWYQYIQRVQAKKSDTKVA